MNRPGPVGVTMVLTFTLVAAIELRTLLGMFGIDVATPVYYAGAAGLLLVVGAALLLLPEASEGNPSRA